MRGFFEPVEASGAPETRPGKQGFRCATAETDFVR
jgi:hypothetical protein